MNQKIKTNSLPVESKVRDFYNNSGWDSDNQGHTTDARLWEDLRPSSAAYVTACRLKPLQYLPPQGDLFLDAASGPIQYGEYLEYSKGFKKRVCVDISQKALDLAQLKLGSHGETHCASILELPFPDNYFDGGVSLHTIYHIDQKDQEQAVRQLLRVMKPGSTLVIIYSNPNKFLSRVKRFGQWFLKSKNNTSEGKIYFHANPISWWNQFKDIADVKALPWRSLTSNDAKRLIPNGKLGEYFLKAVLFFEKVFPKAALHLGAYPMFVLKKRI